MNEKLQVALTALADALERRISGLEGPRSALAQAVRVELNLLLVSWQLIGSYK